MSTASGSDARSPVIADPVLTFFAELSGRELVNLLSPHVIRVLASRGAGVSMAMIDLDASRAAAVARLNDAGIDVTAWLVLPHEHGYWLTADNAPLALARGREVLQWSADQGLRLQALGLDIEPPHADTVGLAHRPIRTGFRLLRARRSRAQLAEAARLYAELVALAHAQGLLVEAYHLPFIDDDRKAGSDLVRRALGLVDVPVDREVWMLYRSAVPALMGRGLVDAYGEAAPCVGVGITGGGVASLRETFAPRELDGPLLVEEIAAAARYAQRVYVFSLEGCVARGTLELACQSGVAGQRAPRTGLWAARLGRAAARVGLKAAALWSSRPRW